MIKIDIEKLEQGKYKYASEILPDIIKRIENLLIALKNIQAPPSLKQSGVRSYGPLTRDAIKIIEDDDKLNGYDFKSANYIASLILYHKNPNNLSKINISGVISLLERLIIRNASLLTALLICRPSKILWLNSTLEKKYFIRIKEKKLLKLAFNYDFSEICEKIRAFFNCVDIAKICPYCNKEETGFIESIGKRKLSGHQLDHFYCKNEIPLLSYSMYNLVPSGEKCNGPNLKHQKVFTEKFHMNPYLSGFDGNVRFAAEVLNKKVIKIQLLPDNCADPSKLSQIFGSGGKIDENSGEGNANVFGLVGRYNKNIKEAEDILNCLNDANTSYQGFIKYMRMITPIIDREKVHKDWYSKMIRTPFEPQKFGDQMFSKFYRDLHDSYYLEDKKKHNDFIRELIKY